MPYLGAHMSIAGGLSQGFHRIRQVRGEALQIFTKNQVQWFAPPLAEEEVEAFRGAWKDWGRDRPVVAHASYLINLANPDPSASLRSVNALIEEIQRCSRLGIPHLILHPGAHLGAGTSKGLRLLSQNLDAAIEKASCPEVTLLIENTAGQGTGLGARFEDLAFVLEHARQSKRLAACFDTAHAFAAGYDLRTSQGYQMTFEAWGKEMDLCLIQCMHLNDAKKGLGSRVDRHEHIGKGEIGLEGFRLLLNDPRFQHLPMLLETPKGKHLKEDQENLRVLRGLIKRSRKAPGPRPGAHPGWRSGKAEAGS